MSYFEILITIVFFCLGLRLVTDEGMLLDFISNFLTKQYKIKDYLDATIGHAQLKIWRGEHNDEIPTDEQEIGSGIFYDEYRNEFYRLISKNYIPRIISKPICLCISCMASLWGTVIYFVATNYGQDFNFYKWVGLCVSASFIQTFIWALYLKIIK